MRTLTGVSRLFLWAAISVAVLLGAGGAYFIGYVGQLERELSGPTGAPERTVGQIDIIEEALGHDGFLKSYHDYWMGDAHAYGDLAKRAAQSTAAAHALAQLGDRDTAATTREIQAVVAAFARASAAVPATPPSGLRGVNDDSIKALPSPAQLETSYLTLSMALERLRASERGAVVSAIGGALDRAKMLIVAAFAVLVGSLVAVAWLTRAGVIQPLSTLERSLAAVAQGAVGQRIWGTERQDEIGDVARAGEALRRRLADGTAAKAAADKAHGDMDFAGPSLVLFERLTAQVANAVNALRAAGEATKHSHDALADGQDRIVQSNEEMRAAIMAELRAIAESIGGVTEHMRGEVSRLIEHIDEERLLPSRAGGPRALLTGPMSGAEAGKTLADVPKSEVLERLGDLAAEMRAISNPTQRAADTALRIGNQASGLFEELGAVEELGPDQELSLEGATADVEALARAVAKLEARAEALSELAVAHWLDHVDAKGAPAELSDKAFAADLRTDGAIQSVFESIERLNNVAAALARAGDAERQRRTNG